jgi:outer membrane receptor for ferrienterochelin and colicins
MKSMKTLLSILLLLVVMAHYPSLMAQGKCDWATLNDASDRFRMGNFEDMIEMLQSCIKEGFDEKQQVQAYRLLSKAYIELDNDTMAVISIAQILRLDQQFQPDYLSDSPRFIEIFQQMKSKNTAQFITSVSKKAENIQHAPATVILLTKQQLKNQGYLDLEAVLHDLPGFDISRSNGNLYSHIYQRGYRSINTNRTLFLIDGVEQNDLWSSNVYFSRQYPMSSIKNIEFVYGPASTMYGSNAFLGVINVITFEPWEMIKPGNVFGTNARVAYGSYNTKFADISLAARSKANNISFGLTGRVFFSDEQDLSMYKQHSYAPRELTPEREALYRQRLNITDPVRVSAFLANYPSTSTYYTHTNGQIILTNDGIARALELDNNVYNNVGFSDKTEAYFVEAKLRVFDFLMGWTYWQKAEGPGAQYNDALFMGSDQGQSWEPKHSYFYLKYDKNVGNKLNISNFVQFKTHSFGKDNAVVRYRRNYTTGHFSLANLIDGKLPAFDSTFLFQKSNQLRQEFKILYQPFDKMDLIAGFEIRYSSIQGDYTFSTKNNAEQNGLAQTQIPGGNHFFTQDYGLYTQSGISLLQNLKLTLGLRYDYNLVRTDEGFGNVFNPRVAIVYFPKQYIFKAIYAEAFKDATNREKYSTAVGKRELPNPTLQPEKVKNFEVSAGRNFDNYLSVEAAGYYSLYSNIIQEVQVDRGNGSFTNQNQAKGQAVVYGINAMANFKWGNIICHANYTFTRPYTIKPTDSQGNPLLDTNGNPFDKLRISDISDHQANLTINYSLKDIININFRTNFIGEKKTGPNTTVPTNPDTFEPVVLFNSTISYTPKKTGFTVQLTVFNLFNKEYFSPGLDLATGDLASSLKQNGRNLYLNVMYEF